jgi:hypothetical protein
VFGKKAKKTRGHVKTGLYGMNGKIKIKKIIA